MNDFRDLVDISRLLMVGAGGFLGAVSRYVVAGVMQDPRHAAFPVGTLTVNLVGSFLIGLAGGVFLEWRPIDPDLRLFLLVGVLGGFTTFSTFSFETLQLLREAEFGRAVMNATLHTAGGIAAAWLGWTLSMMIWRVR